MNFQRGFLHRGTPCRLICGALILGTSGLVLSAGSAHAEGPNEKKEAKESKERKEEQPVAEVKGLNDVYVGVYVNQIYDLSLKDNRYVVDFWVWFRWKNDAYKPLESFEVIDGRSTSIEHKLYDPELKNGFHYAQARVTATTTRFFDVANYPLDNHTLHIQLEDSRYDAGVIHFLPDTENSFCDKEVQVSGWEIGKAIASVAPHVYETNYGDPTAPKQSTYSRFDFAISIVRVGWGGFTKLYFALFISVFAGLLQFRVSPEEIIARLTLGVGAIIGVMTSQFVIVESLPDTDQLNMADKFHMLGILFVFISLAESVWVNNLAEHKREHLARKIDGIFFYGCVSLYCLINILIVRAA
jgi:hypothetical protein